MRLEPNIGASNLGVKLSREDLQTKTSKHHLQWHGMAWGKRDFSSSIGRRP